MRRRWRIGRLILAGLLLGLAVMLYLLWPSQPRWSIQGEKALGFDLSRGLLLTASLDQPEFARDFHLHGYDLKTGKCTYDLPISLGEGNNKDWEMLLSEDGSKLAHYGNDVTVFDLHQDGRLLMKCKPGFVVHGWCFSKNSSSLAFLSNDEVEVWDIAAGERKAQFTIPQKMISSRMSGPDLQPSARMQFSSDERYLAICGNGNDVIILDWQSEKEIGICHHCKSPMHFVSNTTLYVTAIADAKQGVKRFQIEDQQLKPAPTLTDEHPQWTSFHAFSNKHILVSSMLHSDFRSPAWIPDNLANNFRQLFGLDAVIFKMCVYDTATEELRHQFDVRIKSTDDIVFVAMLFESMFKLSPDGLFIIHQTGYETALWDVPPRRSPWCWIICLGICLLALFLAWPRRVVIQK